jgi:hypothetical protein
MAEYFKGTLLTTPIVRSASGDTYGTHHSVLGIGGYMEVKTVAERNLIPPYAPSSELQLGFDEISVGQRRLGMIVHVLETNSMDQLHPKIGDHYVNYNEWMTGYTSTQKINALANNSNWHGVLTTGDDSDTAGEKISKEYTQSGNSFVLGDVIGFDGTDFVRVNASTAMVIEPLGIVTTAGDPNFMLTYAGGVNTAGMVDYSGRTLSAATVYYLASTGETGPYVDGKLTNVAPSALSEVSKPMLVILSGNSGVVLQYRGLSKSQEGVTWGDFNIYSASTRILLDAEVTGATNIGFFSGKTGVQKLHISTISPVSSAYQADPPYYYTSLYNNYYIDSTGVVRIGSPTYHGLLRRGYVRGPVPVVSPVYKSWVWNEYVSSGSTNPRVGWIFLDGDVSELVGVNVSVNLQTYYAPDYTDDPYIDVNWISGYSNGSNAVLSYVYGSLNTGSTYVIGGPVYSDKQYKELRMRTIMSNSPGSLSVTYDDNFVYISGITTAQGITGTTGGKNVGTGQHVYSGMTGTTLAFRTLIGSGNTMISTVGNNIVIYSSGGTGGAGGTYNLSSPSVIPLGGICSGTVLTGKTSFQLFEELLVPELCGTITPPSISNGLSASGLYEIGCTVSETVTGTFSRGSISPQYCSLSPFRSGCVNAYCFTGTGMPPGWQATTSSPYFINNPSYTVVIGTQSWGVCARYDAGLPALGSKGTQYSAALPSGCTSAASDSIVGAYPLFATTVNITTCTKQTLQNMSTANNVQVNLVTESGGNKQKFEIPCAWLGAPTNRPLVGVCQWNTVSSQWEYPGGSAGTSLAIWTASPASETVQGSPIGYCQYTYNSTDRSAVCIRLVF